MAKFKPTNLDTSVFQTIRQASGQSSEGDHGGTILLPLDQIDANPQQARQSFSQGGLAELATSIREHGVLQPVGVRRVGDRYRLIYGERRWRASRLAERSDIPATIYDVDEAQAAVMTALENLQREDLDIEDEARYFQTLLDLTNLSQRKLAAKLGIDYNYLSRRVRLLKRPDLLEAYRNGRANLHGLIDTEDDQLSVSLGHTDSMVSDERGVDNSHLVSVSQGHNTSVADNNEDDQALREPQRLSSYKGHSTQHDDWLTPKQAEESSGELVEREELDQRQLTTQIDFRWRPYQQVAQRLQQTQGSDIPPAERDSFRSYLRRIRAELERLERELGQ